MLMRRWFLVIAAPLCLTVSPDLSFNSHRELGLAPRDECGLGFPEFVSEFSNHALVHHVQDGANEFGLRDTRCGDCALNLIEFRASPFDNKQQSVESLCNPPKLWARLERRQIEHHEVVDVEEIRV